MPGAGQGFSSSEVGTLTDGSQLNGINIADLLGQELDNPTYPTNSLNFLRNVRAKKPLKLSIVVVGAGIGGLSAAVGLARQGHNVQILEQSAALGEVGAGIQIPPNSTRILLDWGLGEFLENKKVEPEGMTFRRWENGEPIAYTRLIPGFSEKYHAPYYVIHRAHFHEALHQLACKLGVRILLSKRVASYDEQEASVTLHDGSKVQADFIVAADGIKSVARNFIAGEENRPAFQTGFAAYRATVDVEKMKKDPELTFLLERPCLNVWIGEDRHVMTYTIAAGKSFNMVLSHVDHSDPSKWTQETAIADMRIFFRGWDNRLVKIINMIDSTMKWPLMAVPPMRKWLSRSGKLIVIGDAAHAMVPYMSQGAAMAVEDAAALAEAFRHVEDMSDTQRVLAVFERVRATRSSQMVQASFINGRLWHFPDGPEQRLRDAAMKPEVEGEQFDESPNQWSDPATQRWAYSYDAVEAITRELC